VLGLVVEAVTGGDYTAHVQQSILGPLGLPAADLQLGASRLQDRDSREPFYSDHGGNGTSVFPPHQSVSWPDGAFYLEAMEAHGGLICTAEAYALFLGRYNLDGNSRNAYSGVFYGSLPGTTSVAVQRSDGINMVAFFNQRNDPTDPSGNTYFEADDQLSGACSLVSVWPTTDVRSVPIPIPNVSFQSPDQNRLEISFVSQPGHVHFLERTPNLRDWELVVTPKAGDGQQQLFEIDFPPESPRSFYRIVTGR